MQTFKRILVVLIIFQLFFFISCKPDEDEKEDEKEDEIKEECNDTIAPIIQFMGELDMVVEVGSDFNLLSGVKGLDNKEGVITNRITINDGGFDAKKIGKYKITYNLVDKCGNEAVPLERVIRVIDTQNAKLVAHRGGKGYGVENTIEAFRAAIENGYYGLECDVQPTKDDQIVVYHDLTLANLTGEDKKIIDCTYAELQEKVLTKTENGVTFTGKIMLFSEYLELIKNSNCVAFVEIKESNTMDSVKEVMRLIKDSGISESQYVLICNSARINLLFELRSEYPTVEMMFVGRTDYDVFLDRCLEYNIGIDLSYQSVGSNGVEMDDETFEKYIEKFKNKGLTVNVWVVNKSTLVTKYLGMGVDYITTDTILPKK